MREIKFRGWYGKKIGMLTPNFNGNINEIFGKGNGEYTQYTGVKDIKNKEIYEGDIVKGKDWENGKEYRFIGEIRYLAPNFKVVGIGNYKGMHYELNALCEVIGNIYENKNLLEEE